jgi:hypothetical protein
VRGGKECGARHYVWSGWYMVSKVKCHEKDGYTPFFADLTAWYYTVMVRLTTHILHLLLLTLFSPRWFAPDEASGFCSKAVTDSSARASTYSLGSICLGSLLTAILQVSN